MMVHQQPGETLAAQQIAGVPVGVVDLGPRQPAGQLAQPGPHPDPVRFAPPPGHGATVRHDQAASRAAEAPAHAGRGLLGQVTQHPSYADQALPPDCAYCLANASFCTETGASCGDPE